MGTLQQGALLFAVSAAVLAGGCGRVQQMAGDAATGIKGQLSRIGSSVPRDVEAEQPGGGGGGENAVVANATPASDVVQPAAPGGASSPSSPPSPPQPQTQAQQSAAVAGAPQQLTQQVALLPQQVLNPRAAAPAQQKQQQAPAAPGRGAIETLAAERYRAACRDFVGIAAERQETDVWCWAACVQMVNNYNGRPSTQADIAERIHGKARDANGQVSAENVKRAGTMEIMLALNPDLHDHYIKEGFAGLLNGRSLRVDVDPTQTLRAWFQERTYSDENMIADVARGMPVVVGLKDPSDAKTGHAYVVHAVTYRATPGALPKTYAYALESVEAVDPWPGKSVTIPAADFQARVGFKISQQLAREVLMKHRSALKVTSREAR